MPHKCDLEDCDGSRLSHQLARGAEDQRVVLDETVYFREHGRLPPRLCPECRQGKCLNCVGQALDPVTDEFVPCEGGAS